MNAITTNVRRLGAIVLCGFAAVLMEQACADGRGGFPTSGTSEVVASWDLEALRQAPQALPAQVEGLEPGQGIRGVFFEGLPYQGKDTRVFAWVGIPDNPTGELLPGIVLVHGGGGTAFHDWVALWMQRGYAAIAIDTSGRVPESTQGMAVKHRRHGEGGPDYGGGGFALALDPASDQWMYHAVADVMLAGSLLASLPEVDESRIGITGISWGGVITLVAAGLDKRFRFAAPVYGCGYLGESSHWLDTVFQQLPPAVVERWISLWDPAQYIGQAEMPMLFCNGTNDTHFRLDSWQKTYRSVQAPVTLSLKIRMKHSHPPAGDPPEIRRYADAILLGGPALAKVGTQGQDGKQAWVEWEEDGIEVQHVDLVYTTDSGPWSRREWRSQSVNVDAAGLRAQVAIPIGSTACFFNLTDADGCVVSSEHFEPVSVSGER